jgi:hypothetical protein
MINNYSIKHKKKNFKQNEESFQKNNNCVISPTHKRTGGRVPVWGSEFTSKSRRTTGGSSRNRCRLNVKLRLLTDWCLVRGAMLLLLKDPILWWSDFLLNALG